METIVVAASPLQPSKLKNLYGDVAARTQQLLMGKASAYINYSNVFRFD